MKSEREKKGGGNEESKQNRDLVRQQSQTEILTRAGGWEKSKKDTKIRSVHRTRHLIQINISTMKRWRMHSFEMKMFTSLKKTKIIFFFLKKFPNFISWVQMRADESLVNTCAAVVRLKDGRAFSSDQSI